MCLDSVAEPARPFLVALLARELQRPVVVVTSGLKEQELFHSNLATYVAALSTQHSALSTLFYPPWETLPHEDILPPVDVVADRLKVLRWLSTLHSQPSTPIVTSVQALLQRTFAPSRLGEMLRKISVGGKLELEEFEEWLTGAGYEAEAQVTQRGEFSVRGGIVDVFPLDQEQPLRIELFGDEIESIRHFDPVSQTSTSEVREVALMPAGELGLLKKGNQPLGSFLDFLPANTIFVFDDMAKIEANAESYENQVPEGDPFFVPFEEVWKQIEQRKGGRVLVFGEANQTMVAQASRLWSFPAQQPPARRLRHHDEPALHHSTTPSLHSLEFYRPVGVRQIDETVAEVQRRSFFEQLRQWVTDGYAVQVFCNNEGEQQRFFEILDELGMKGLTVHPQLGTLSQGFLFEEARLVVVTDAEIFGRYKVPRPRRLATVAKEKAQSKQIVDFTELEEGDFVVHFQHGIGKYIGLRQIETQGQQQEVLAIAYANDARLYVPVAEAHLVSKYVGVGKRIPELSQIGGTRWAKAKETAERAIMDLASSLLEIQAARESQTGFACPPDVPWQHEFESAFIYQETPDQLTAIADVKRDMESKKPMDRLICGDVGYGKTEVAIRAAFKAVMAGKQVAVLVPTTVLAQQHFNTFTERMADYPVRIEMLSRFRSKKQQRMAVELLREGGLDIVIGTHRLVQPDVHFKDLGLVVIDEEQRFGVLHKERFKQLRRMVDVLTLSATPIPRTLYLSLTGARDMSTIETAPQERLPVETIITEWNERIIRDAIIRELSRGGQVYFLHNRIESIEGIRDRLKVLLAGYSGGVSVPLAAVREPNNDRKRDARATVQTRPVRIEIGHGQMHEDDLESVMLRFVNGEIDVLVCTTIIESGLDIPNVNTIIIDRADRFGLSDLYQLRGRVGRWKHKAYAYLLLPRHAALIADARKRMTAIQQYSKLGSGFKIAMRDLEIRGAGNILGSEQSGHITAVGFDLYCQLLRESIARLKGQPIKKRAEVTVRFDFLTLLADHAEEGKILAAIPHKYISDQQLRVDAYRKIAQIADEADVKRLRREFVDRYGKLPIAAELLLEVAWLKAVASFGLITTVEVAENKVMLTRGGDFITIGGKFPRLVSKGAEEKLREIRRLIVSMKETK